MERKTKKPTHLIIEELFVGKTQQQQIFEGSDLIQVVINRRKKVVFIIIVNFS